jgi:DNA-binding NarL/FixJ family response regulator
MTIRIVVADDHQIVREGLVLLLLKQPDMEVVGEAKNGREALFLVRKLLPDILLTDISMPELNGLEAARQINEEKINTRVVVLSIHGTSEYIYRALQAGVMGYLLKESAGQELIQAVRSAFKGERYLSQRIEDKVILDYISQNNDLHRNDPLDRLSSREREVLQLVVEGKSTNEIAEITSLSRSTVETYRSRLMQKLAVDDLTELVKLAIRYGITDIES